MKSLQGRGSEAKHSFLARRPVLPVPRSASKGRSLVRVGAVHQPRQVLRTKPSFGVREAATSRRGLHVAAHTPGLGSPHPEAAGPQRGFRTARCRAPGGDVAKTNHRSGRAVPALELHLFCGLLLLSAAGTAPAANSSPGLPACTRGAAQVLLCPGGSLASAEQAGESSGAVHVPGATAMENLSNANSRFALDLFRRVNETNPTGNVFFSPVSVSAALAMVLLGAKGNTEAQVLKTLHFDEVEDIHSRFRTLTTDINRRDAFYLLRIANRLFGEKSYSFLPDFLTNIQKLYGADLATVDFLQACDEARKEINQWVEEKTEGKIPNLLSEGSVDGMTKLVLVNAIYFKGNWAEKFEEANTVEMPFRLNKNERKTVKMMYQKKKFRFGYISDMKIRVLELPYEGRELSMIILLPDDIEDDSTGLQKLEKHLTLEKLQEWTCPEHLYSTDVHVHLPKFKLEESYDLKSDLVAMGLLDLFESAKADLSGMSGARDLFLSKIVHKAFVEVNEEGTEAAAATAGIAMLCMVMEEDFNADHPFLFFIRHNPTQSILFFGKYASP